MVRKQTHPNVLNLLKKIGVAALTTVLVYFTFVFLHHGKLFFVPFMLWELLFAFLFLLGVFWSHGKISVYINSKALRKLKPFPKALLEAFLVVASSVFFVFVVNYLPIFLLFPDVDPPPGRIRAGVLVSTIISLFFYYFVERERSRKKLQEELLRSAQLQKENFQAQLESLKSQVNPHFLFNSLNVLGSLIYKDQDMAVEFLRQLSEVYRALLDNSKQSLVPLRKELELVKSYNYLLKTRFGENLQFEIVIPPEKLEYQLPPISLQMLIENAIKHNGSTAKRPLKIRIYVEGQKLVIANNLQPRMEEVKSTGLGLQNIKSRYKYLSEQKVEVEQNTNEFVVKLPLLQVEAYEDINY